jgi:tRNA threonylcarbamoyladenosine biosynthesis protein TsaE
VACLTLADPAATAAFGALCGRHVAAHFPDVTCLLLNGPLGSGKTALARAMAHAMPGGDMAEVASPSFTVCNRYPTTPGMAHCDLYRCAPPEAAHAIDGLTDGSWDAHAATQPELAPWACPDDVTAALEDPATLTVIEWGAFLPSSLRPPCHLDITLAMRHGDRSLTIDAHGAGAEGVLRQILGDWASMRVGIVH